MEKRGEEERKHDGLNNLSEQIHALIYTWSKRAREGSRGGDLNSSAISTILDCIDYSLLSLSHTHASSLSLPFCPSLPLSVCSATFSARRSAFGFFHLWQITVTLLYNFLPPLALVLKTAKAELVALTFSPLCLELQELYEERK